MRATIVFLLIVVFLSACTPPGVVEEVAQPTPTRPKIFVPTIVLVSPTVTLVPTATLVPSATPDLRIGTTDPKEFLLSVYDLPIGGKYYLPKNGLTPLRNREVIQSMGAEKGEQFINETGRLDGWTVRYQRGASNLPLPEQIVDTVVMYQTTEGAQLSIENYATLNLSPAIRKILSPPLTGDLSLALSLTRGSTVEQYYYFSYRNYVHRLEVRGLQSEVTLELVGQLAGVLLDKLEYAPLYDP